MKHYFDLLDLSPTATLAEIKVQYQLLMRIYNPERFSSPEDKTFAERMREKLSEAYRLLIQTDWATPHPSDEAALPRVEPTLIDWGMVNQGDRLASRVQIHCASQPQRLLLTPNEDADWLVAGLPDEIQAADKTIIAFDVLADTKDLTVGKRYIGQIKVDIDHTTHYVFLMLKIEPPFPYLYVNHHWRQLDEVRPYPLRNAPVPTIGRRSKGQGKKWS